MSHIIRNYYLIGCNLSSCLVWELRPGWLLVTVPEFRFLGFECADPRLGPAALPGLLRHSSHPHLTASSFNSFNMWSVECIVGNFPSFWGGFRMKTIKMPLMGSMSRAGSHRSCPRRACDTRTVASKDLMSDFFLCRSACACVILGPPCSPPWNILPNGYCSFKFKFCSLHETHLNFHVV